MIASLVGSLGVALSLNYGGSTAMGGLFDRIYQDNAILVPLEFVCLGEMLKLRRRIIS
jgi:hypothetical protein